MIGGWGWFAIIWLGLFVIDLFICMEEVEDAIQDSKFLFNERFLRHYMILILFAGAPYWFIAQMRDNIIMWKVMWKVRRICKKDNVDFDKIWKGVKEERKQKQRENNGR